MVIVTAWALMTREDWSFTDLVVLLSFIHYIAWAMKSEMSRAIFFRLLFGKWIRIINIFSICSKTNPKLITYRLIDHPNFGAWQIRKMCLIMYYYCNYYCWTTCRFLENGKGHEIPSIHGHATRLMLDTETPLSPPNWVSPFLVFRGRGLCLLDIIH